MKIKSLLIGSAMAAGLTTGAQAADAIVYADPEPMEYVRICDVYGAGFYYIPGTETCLRIGGYMRFQMDMQSVAGAVWQTPSFNGYTTLARFAPNFDVRSSSDWGTIRGFAELEFDYRTGGFQGTTLRHAFIDIGDRNFLRIGRNWSPYGIWAGPGGNINDGIYGRRTVNNIAYYFNSGQPSGIAGGGIAPGAGFSGFIALVDNERTVVYNGGASIQGSNQWNTDVEAGVGFGWQGGFFRVAAAYDSNAYDVFNDNRVNVFSAKAGIQQAFGSVTARAAVLYNGNTNVQVGAQNYGLGTAGTFGSRWSILGGLDFAFSPAAKAVLTAQWFDDPHGAGVPDGASARWTVAAGVDLTPATGLRLRPELNYINRRDGSSGWGGVIRLDRTF